MFILLCIHICIYVIKYFVCLLQFDTALQRFIAMKATGYDHFKPTPKTTILGMMLVGIPILGYAYLLKSVRDKDEHKYRTGQVAYRDRRFKFQ